MSGIIKPLKISFSLNFSVSNLVPFLLMVALLSFGHVYEFNALCLNVSVEGERENMKSPNICSFSSMGDMKLDRQ